MDGVSPAEITEQTVSGWGFTKNTGTSTFSGSYNDLTDKPTIPTVDSTWVQNSTNPVESRLVFNTILQKVNNQWDQSSIGKFLKIDSSGAVNVFSVDIPQIWRGTQAQYDALSPNYDNNTIYIIS